jgi:hypothetical protein
MDYLFRWMELRFLPGKQLPLFTRQLAVVERLRITKFLIAGPARGLETSMRELVAEHLKRQSMLHAHRDDRAETLHQSRDHRALLCHPDEDLTRLHSTIASIYADSTYRYTPDQHIKEPTCRTKEKCQDEAWDN